jgi:hypothetical protein
MTSPEELRGALRMAVPDTAWLDGALDRVAVDPASIGSLFPAAGRRCGRGPLDLEPGWTVDDAARVLLLIALPLRGDRLAAEVEVLYRYGSADEKRAVLRALPLLDTELGDRAVELLHDAIRTNDTRLVAAALSRYAHHLGAAMWRQAVLKCAFMGIPLTVVHGLADRADAELGVMLAGLAVERQAAGREMPADALALLDRLNRSEPAAPEVAP